jgi:putative salt-induced outer membrane protein
VCNRASAPDDRARGRVRRAAGAFRILAAASLAILTTASVCAQTPAAPAQPPPPPPRLEATAQFGLLATTGNTSTQSLALGGEFAHRPGLWVHSGKIAFAQNEDEGTLKARSLAGNYRSARTLTSRLSAYGQYAYLRDTFSGIEHRHTVEGGLSYLAVDRDPHRLRFDGALGYEREIRRDAEDTGSAVAIGGLAYRWKISETSEFTDEARGIATLADLGAWKLDQVASLTAALTSILSLRVSNTVRFSHEPVPGFERTDTITSVALVMKFSRPGP